MNFKMIIAELLNYDNLNRKSIFSDDHGKKTLNRNIPDKIKIFLKKTNIKNPTIEESDKYYFITLNNSSTSDNLFKILKYDYSIADLIFEKGKLTIVIMK